MVPAVVPDVKRILIPLLLAALPLRAHDFWIEPSTFTPAVGETVTASLRVGENFEGQPVARSSQLLAEFIARDATGPWEIPGFENEDPAGLLRVERGGLTVLGYRSHPYTHTLTAEQFRRFLSEEGVEGLRVKGGVREQFIRYAKAALVAEEASELDRVLGFRCEIVREAEQGFRVLYEGKPLANALVVAMHRDGARLSARTNAQGRVTLKIDRAGEWLVKSVKVVRAPAGSGADWESLWPSLTFAVRSTPR
jgi:hypothetical protein